MSPGECRAGKRPKIMAAAVALFFYCCIAWTFAQGPDNQGTEFILAFMDNRFMSSRNDLEIFLTTVVNDPVDVNITAPLYTASTVDHRITVTRGNVEMVTLPADMRGEGTELTGQTAWIVASDEVVVYVVNKEQYSTDAYVAIPTDALGSMYRVMTYYDETEFAIVGTVDGTTVDITFPYPNQGSISVTYNGVTYTDGQTLTITINRFQTFHCFQDSGYLPDFTGAYIESDQPISVIAGNKKVIVDSGSSSDHLVEALVPVECWGREFYSYSTPDRGRGDIVRVLASEDSTTVTFETTTSGTFSNSLNAGEHVELNVDSGDVMRISADKGINVGIFSKTFANDGPNYGDPAFSFIIAQPLFASDYTYSTIKLPNGNDFNNKLTITILEDYTDGLRLDEEAFNITWTAVPGTDYVTGWLYVSAGTHNVYHTDPSKTFMALATGTEQYNSYAFASGMRMTQINMPCVTSSPTQGDILDNDCDGQIDEELEDGIDNDGDGAIDEDFSLPPRVNGNWGEWGNWSACSVTCLATGYRSRTRECDDPPAANNGLDCSGISSETEVCANATDPCGVWSEWSEWSPCSVTCNDGTRTRDRNCTDIYTGIPDTCSSGEYNETGACDVGPIQGTCYNNVSGICTCDWGYSGNNCEWCMGNYTGCYCEVCENNLIGWNTSCSTTCYNGYASIFGGDECECYENTTMGFWENDICTDCMTGFIQPDCLDCDTGWVGSGHCSIPCQNGSHAFDYDGTTGNDDIIPEFSCLDGGNMAWFGYSSFNSKVVTIDLGPDNYLEGTNASSQTTEFRPGLHQYAFSAGPFTPGSVNVTWNLNVSSAGISHSVSVPDVYTSCSGTPVLDNLAAVDPAADIGYCKCEDGFYGASCTYECPGGSASSCSDHGDCRKTDGYCLCQSRWTSVIYDYDLYDDGYRDPDPTYTCNICTTDWYGDDCSTALLNRTNYNVSTAGDSSDHFAFVSSSAVVTLDGASMELVRPGLYRLLDVWQNGFTVDGYFLPCRGRYDCHSLAEVVITGWGTWISVAIDQSTNQLKLNSSLGTDTTSSFSATEGNVTLTYTAATQTARVSVTNGPSVVAGNVQGEFILGVTIPANSTEVDGLLGVPDGDYMNDMDPSGTGGSTGVKLMASSKASSTDDRFRLAANGSTLYHFDPTETGGSGGYAMFLNGSDVANATGLPLVQMSALTIEFWVKIPDPSASSIDLLQLATNLGVVSISTQGGALAATWDNTFTSSLSLRQDTWTYVALSWNGNSDGNFTLHTIESGSNSGNEDGIDGVYNGTTIQSISSLQLGAGGDTSIYMDYVRVFDKVRNEAEMVADFLTYTDEFIDNQVLILLMDEGGASSNFSVNSFYRDLSDTHVGIINSLSASSNWVLSDMAYTTVTTMDELPARVTAVNAIAACRAELESTTFTTNCEGFGSIHQLLVENCISDYSRASLTSDVDPSAIVKLAGSALAFLCQGVTQKDQCIFDGYLDFCPSAVTVNSDTSSSSSGGMLFAIIGAVAGLAIIAAIIAACCCCCPKALCGRKKIFDSDTEEEEEEEEEPEEEEMPPIQDSSSTTELTSAGLKAGAGAGMVSAAALTMRQPGKMSLGEEKPFEPLHKGRWTPYGWLPGARPVEGVSSDAPDEIGVDQYGNPSDGEPGAAGMPSRPATAARPPTATQMPQSARPLPPPAAPAAALGPAMAIPVVGSVPAPAPQPSMGDPQFTRGGGSRMSMADSRANTVSSIAISLDSCEAGMAPVDPSSTA